MKKFILNLIGVGIFFVSLAFVWLVDFYIASLDLFQGYTLALFFLVWCVWVAFLAWMFIDFDKKEWR